jgi:anti-anti-sigma factor
MWMGDAMASYIIQHKDNRGLIQLAGDLTAGLVPDLQVELKRALDKGATQLVFDLENTVMLDSSGMGLLIATSNSLTRIGGEMQVINASSDILRLLQCMRLAGRLNVNGSSKKEHCHG